MMPCCFVIKTPPPPPPPPKYACVQCVKHVPNTVILLMNLMQVMTEVLSYHRECPEAEFQRVRELKPPLKDQYPIQR